MPPAPPIRAFIVEDEPAARHYLAELLATIEGVELVGAAARLADVEARGFAELAARIDVCFIDVHLGGGRHNDDGLVVARALAATAEPPLLVFATASAEHAIAAIDLGSVAYLRKPFDDTRVLASVARVRDQLAQRRRPTPAGPRRLVGRSRTGLVFLTADEVWAFGAETRLITMYAAAGAFDVDLSLANLEQALGDRVLRVHRQWLVQPAHVRALERHAGELVLFLGELPGSGGLRVPVARDRAAAVRDALLATTVGLRA
jgi:two-component system, LytTR family, response regulator LytT